MESFSFLNFLQTMHVLPLFLTAHVVFSAVCTKADITALNTAFDIAVNRKAQPCLDFIPRIKKLDLDERQKEYCEGNVCDTFLIALDGFTDYPDCIHEGEAVSVSLPRAFDDLVIRIDTLRKTACKEYVEE